MPADDRNPARSGEFELIGRYFRPLAHDFPGSFDLRDDAAVLRPGTGEELVVTADAMVAGVHFLPDDPAGDVARKLMRVNLSDLAAMGARPLAYVVTAAWPPTVDDAWIADFAAGLGEDQRTYGLSLIGGDTVSTPGPLTLSLTAFGTVPAGQALHRSTAQVGDDVYVSGTIGDAAAGLIVLKGGAPQLDPADRDVLVDRYCRPAPRCTLGSALVGLAHACIDVSDGLVADLGHIVEESSVGAEIDLAGVPRSAPGRAVCDDITAITGGDDYELLFTAAPGQADRVAAVAADSGVVIAQIGRIVAGRGVVVRDAAGRPVPVETAGYTHF